MPLPTYTVSLGAANLTSGGEVLMHTIAGPGTTVLRDLVVTNGDADPHQIWVSVALPGGGLVYIYREPAQVGQTAEHLELRQVLPSGSQIMVGTTGQNATFAATGYQFS